MTIQEKLDQLRKDWKKYPKKRSVIELKAKVLKAALNYEDYKSPREKKSEELLIDASETLL